jgi:hypothetical protein
MHKAQSLFNLTTALHVSGVIITHLQEHKKTVTTLNIKFHVHVYEHLSMDRVISLKNYPFNISARIQRHRIFLKLLAHFVGRSIYDVACIFEYIAI